MHSNGNSQILSCRHCGNISKLEPIGKIREDHTDSSDDGRFTVDSYHEYHILKCHACSEPTITRFFWHELSNEGGSSEILYPAPSGTPPGLPESILKAFGAAERVKNVDVNAYAILMRRMLEMVCIDRGASSNALHHMLKELATANEIPEKLVNVAKGLKDFGNIGAHAGSGELTEEEIPILAALATAVLEYVYSAPHLATIAEEKLKEVKARS